MSSPKAGTNPGGTKKNAPQNGQKEKTPPVNGPKASALVDAAEKTNIKDASAKEMAEGEKPKHKPAPMPKEVAAVFEGLEGEFRYSGASLSFEGRDKKECNLITGGTYDINKLPKHELIANAIVRKTLLPVPPKTQTEEEES